MCKTTKGKVQLRLIDYESLCPIKCSYVLHHNERCFHEGFSNKLSDQRNAFALLWWQCLLMAYAWLYELSSSTVDAQTFVYCCCHGRNLPTYFEGFLHRANLLSCKNMAKTRRL